jgi:copper homeostasis protein
MQQRSLEIACFSLEAAHIAAKAGAHRIEFCVSKMEDGLSPTLQELEQLLQQIDVAVHVMLRPRGGNFVYTEEEFKWMQAYLLEAKKLPVTGFVFGCLNQNNVVNKEQNSLLVALAGKLPCTFHKAIDVVEDMEQGLEDIIACGFSYVLSSGGKPSALAGKDVLKVMHKQANGRIVIMPGGGIRSTYLEEIITYTEASWVHSSAILDGGEMPDAAEIKKLLTCLN